MKESYSPRQVAARKAHMRRLRAQHRRRMAVAILSFFILGVVAGIFAYRWFDGRPGKDITSGKAAPTAAAQAVETATPEPEATARPEQTPEAWAMPEEDEDGEDLFSEEVEVSREDVQAEQDAFPEIEAEPASKAAEEASVEDGEASAQPAEPVANAQAEAPTEDKEQPEAEEAAEAEDKAETEDKAEAEKKTEVEDKEQPEAEEKTDAEDKAEAEEKTESVEKTETEEKAENEEKAEADEEEAETGEEVKSEETAQTEEKEEADAAQQSNVAAGEPLQVQAEPTKAPDLASDQVPEYDPEQEEVPEEYITLPDENGIVEAEEGGALTSYGPQVVAIVPYGESFTYMTEIDANGNARVEAGDAPYETVSFTQTMKSYMRPTDFANKYSTQYKLQGDEAGAGFELILNDYTGEATIIPQNVVDISLRSESGNTVERGYQLMDAEIAGNYGVALTTNTPKMLYKRYQFSDSGEEMAYLVVTTYKDGQTQMILFELESDEPEPEPEVVYNILQRGIKSDEVLAMQNRLIELGYLSGNVDGSFGPKTEEAIKAAQAAFGMEQTGIADSAFQKKLFEGAAPSVGQGTGYVTLSDGSVGDFVKRLQSRLKELGYYEGRIDGGYGPMMVAAVKKAQAAFGMEQTGVADSAFQERAFAGAETQASATPAPADDGVTLRNGSTGDAVVKLQVSLREQGFYSGKADGGYGPNTENAVKAAQAAFGMEQTGVADAAFQQKLYGEDAAPAQEDGAEDTEPAQEDETEEAAEAEPASEAAENTVG